MPYGQNGALILNSNNGYYAVGADNISFMGLFKLNKSGDSLWSQWYGNVGMTGGTFPVDIHWTSDSNIIILGNSWPFAGARDMYVLKTDTLGNKIWDVLVHTNHELNAKSIRQTPDGCFIACANIYNAGTHGDIYVVKIDSSGSIIWRKTFSFTDSDFNTDLVITSVNSYIITGDTDPSPTNYDGLIFEIDSAGNLIWNKFLGDSMLNHLHTVLLTQDSNLLISGYTVNPLNQNQDAWIIKTTLTGDTIWSFTYGNTSDREVIYSCVSKDSVYYLGGRSQSSISPNYSEAFMLAIDSQGNEIWFNKFPNGQNFQSIIYDDFDNSIVASGYTNSYGPDQNFYLVKTNMNGVLNSIYDFYDLNVDDQLFSIFPNPTSSDCQLINNSNYQFNKISIEIYNEYGLKKLKTTSTNLQENYELNLASLKCGIYLIRIILSNEDVYSTKIINKKIIKLY